MDEFWRKLPEAWSKWLRVKLHDLGQGLMAKARTMRLESAKRLLTDLNASQSLDQAIQALSLPGLKSLSGLYLEEDLQSALMRSCERFGIKFILHLSTIMNEKASIIYPMFSKLLRVAFNGDSAMIAQFIDDAKTLLSDNPHHSPAVFYAFKVLVLQQLEMKKEEDASKVLYQLFKTGIFLLANLQASKSVSSLLDLLMRFNLPRISGQRTQSNLTLTDILEMVNRMQCKPQEIFFNKLLDFIAKNGHNTKNSELILEVMIKSKIKASLVTFNTLLDIYISQKNLKMAWYLFDSLIKNKDPRPDAYTYCTMIGGLRRVQPVDLETIEKIYRMYCEESENQIDMVVTNCMLDVYVITGNERKGHELIEDMKNKHRLMPDVATFNTLLKGCSMKKNLQAAEKLLADMKSSGVQQNKVTYNTMMDVCVKNRRLERALELFTEMTEVGCQPDQYTYSILFTGIKASASNEAYEASMAKLSSLLSSPTFLVDEVFFNSLMDVACRFGDSERVENYFQMMRSRGIKPSSISYGILIKSYGKEKLSCKIKQAFAEMTETYSLEPNEITYGSLLEALLQSECVQDADLIFRQLPKKGVQVNSVILSTMIKGYSRHKMFNTAFEIFDRERFKENQNLNLVCYNSVIDSAVNARDLERAQLYFKDMQSCGIAPDLITYSIMIKGHCMEKNAKAGVSLLKQMMSGGVAPDVRIFNGLLDCCASFKDCGKGLHVLSQMEVCHCKPNVVTFGIAVKLYGFSKEVEKAFALLDQMNNLDVKPSLIFFTNLIHISFANKKPHLAVKAFDILEKYAVVPDDFCARKLIEGLQKWGKNLQEVENIKKRLSVYGLKFTSSATHKKRVLEDKDQDRENFNEVNFTTNTTALLLEKNQISVNVQAAKVSNQESLVTSQGKPRQFGTSISNCYQSKARSGFIR